MDPVIRARDFLRDNIGHMTRPGVASFNAAAQRWLVPICLRTRQGDVVIGDIELDCDGHLIYAPSRQELSTRAEEVLARSSSPDAEATAAERASG